MAMLVGILVGFVLGLTGSGGAIMAVPMFMLMLGLSASDAMGISLGVVSASALVGSAARLRQRQVAWMPGMLLAAGGVATVPLGRWLGAQIDEQILLTAFTLLASYIAARMWRQADRKAGLLLAESDHGAEPQCAQNGTVAMRRDLYPISLLLPAGLVVGLISGLFGVGGGFLIVPVLALLADMEIKQATGTSLLVVALISATGFFSHFALVAAAPYQLMLLAVLGGLIGALIGTVSARRISGLRLQKLYAVCVVGLMALSLAKTLL